MSAPRYQIGTYALTIIETALGESKNGIPQFAVKASVDYSKSASGEEFDCPGGTATIYFYFSGGAIEYAARDLKALGYTGRGFGKLAEHNFIGVKFDGYCKHEAYNGEQREKWMVSQGSAPLEMKPIAADKLRKLDAQFGKYFEGAPQAPLVSQPRPPAAPLSDSGPQPVPFEATDADVPF